jgi:hypothetical protein
MICNPDDKKLLMQYAPALFPKLIELDHVIQQYGFEITLRDSDHTYDSFRYGVNQIGNYDASKLEEQCVLKEKIEEMISSTCCQCGSDFHVSLDEHYDARYDSSIFNNKCLLCQAKNEQNDGFKRVLKYAMANTFAQKENKIIQLPQIKVRLLNSHNDIFHDYLQNLFVNEDTFIVSNKYNVCEPVKYAGMSLGVRDVNGERLYEGDLVVATRAEDGRQFWGMAYLEANKWGNHPHKNPLIPMDIMIEHGNNNFPSPLTWAGSFKIVGNIMSHQRKGLFQRRLHFDLDSLKKSYRGLASMYNPLEFSNYF